MKKHKRPFEAYEELALDIRTVREVLIWMTHLYGRAGFTNKVLAITKKLELIQSQLEDEMFEDYPEKADTNVFYGGGPYTLNIRKHPDYIFSSFGKKVCAECDAFIVLTKQGLVLTSDDAKLTFAEDNALYALNKKLIERKEKGEEWEGGNT